MNKEIELFDEELEEVSGGAWTVNGMKRIGEVTISGKGIEIKTQPSNSAKTTLTLDFRWCPVYEIEQNEGLIWYRVSEKMYVAQQAGVTFKMLG